MSRCTAKDAMRCEWPHCQCGVDAWPWLAKKHGIERRIWEGRFSARIADRARGPDNEKLVGEALLETVREELEPWPEGGDPHNGPDWMVTLPEDAADEQMSNWLQDQEP